MAQLIEILKIERERTDDSRGVVHLFQEGSFYRAYEWSAWLCSRYNNSFKVTNKNFRNIEGSVCFIGFPVTSLEKYTPDGADVESVEDKYVRMYLPLSLVPDDFTIDMMATDYDAWKSSLPVAEQKKKEEKHTGPNEDLFVHPARKQLGMTEIMRNILTFPIENRTPMQCAAFLAEIKEQLVGLY